MLNSTGRVAVSIAGPYPPHGSLSPPIPRFRQPTLVVRGAERAHRQVKEVSPC